MHQCSHIVPQSFWSYFSHNTCSYESFGHASLLYTIIPSHCIQVDIERLFIQSSCQLHNFWGSKIDEMVINSSIKLISVKVAIPIPNILPVPVVNIWLIFDLQKHVSLTLFTFLKIFIGLKKWEFIACWNRQFEHTVGLKHQAPTLEGKKLELLYRNQASWQYDCMLSFTL